jgi:antitoxin (DNA-binding transcriptional repressor) of toxin-antitoxin stability system
VSKKDICDTFCNLCHNAHLNLSEEKAMKTLGMREIRASSGVLAEALLEAGEVILTNHGKPFARVVPFNGAEEQAKPARAFPSMAWLRSQMKPLEEGSEVDIRADRDARD